MRHLVPTGAKGPIRRYETPGGRIKRYIATQPTRNIEQERTKVPQKGVLDIYSGRDVSSKRRLKSGNVVAQRSAYSKWRGRSCGRRRPCRRRDEFMRLFLEDVLHLAKTLARNPQSLTTLAYRPSNGMALTHAKSSM